MDHQRLDKWLWCARFARQREDCARIAESGLLRINRRPTGKSHARVRPGDVLTLPLGDTIAGRVRVVRVLALSTRRGPPSDALTLYEDLPA
jgi:ribosome-associated heat shock protein Hsp15